jgi:GR25 family glycosyltransferase involved in LPS biosynthesis
MVDSKVVFDGGLPLLSTTTLPSFVPTAFTNSQDPDWSIDPLMKLIAENTFIFIGFKNSTDIIHQLKIMHHHLDIATTATDNYSTQSFLLGMVKSFVEKENKRNMYTLWQNAHKYDQSICGQYISYWDLYQCSLTGTNEVPIKFPVVIKFDDILHLQAFSEYPNFAFGDLDLNIRLTLNGLVWCCVDPIESLKILLPTIKFENNNNTLYVQTKEVISKIDSHSFSNVYDYRFNQANQKGRMSTNALVCVNGIKVEFASYDTKDVTIRPHPTKICSAESTIVGYTLKSAFKNAFIKYYENKPWVVPAEKITIQYFNGPVTPYGVDLASNFQFTNTKSFCILFPQNPHDCTCFQNPCLDNAYIQFNNKQFPTSPCNTLSPEHLKYNLDAMWLKGIFYAPQEIENSYTILPGYEYPNKGNVPQDNTNYVWWTLLDRPTSNAFYSEGINAVQESVKLSGRYIHMHNPNKTAPDVVDNIYCLNRHNNEPNGTTIPLQENKVNVKLCTVGYSFWFFTVGAKPLYCTNDNWNVVFKQFFPELYEEQVSSLFNS